MLTRRLLMGALATAASGCYGQFALTRKLYEWNGSLGNKFLNTVVMWAFLIIPVYEVCSFVDLVVLNLIEFWTGTNPMAVLEHEDGSQTRLTRLSPDTVRLERLVGGVVIDTLELQRATADGTGVMALDQRGAVLRQAEIVRSGAVVASTAHARFEWSTAAMAKMTTSQSVIASVTERMAHQGAFATR